MTELIVALDGPRAYSLSCRLYEEAGVRWFKVGPQGLVDGLLEDLLRQRDDGIRMDLKIFLDLKLPDTKDTCRAAAKRFAEVGIAAVSTFTREATEAALDGARGTNLRVWMVHHLTDQMGHPVSVGDSPKPDGVICPVTFAKDYAMGDNEIVCPGIRRREDSSDGHRFATIPEHARTAGAHFAVVGRPIWRDSDPVGAALDFKSRLEG